MTTLPLMKSLNWRRTNRYLPRTLHADEAGISLDVIRHYAGKVPLLGVCLGHQAIAQAFGARIVRATKVMHGKTSPITHQQQGVFRGLNNPLTVTRYHSLLIDPDTLAGLL
ncbi:Para-aminobenzoate synthase glutamine amidotransferase component II [Kluyvera cryocrescens]|uniref:Para-aminobenzoate synthase glutamine amidotransferase component II n=1 Tax=Kluyvera cryocrescens TaxID=580 RepID=A0A485ARC1_KLUCR|nr:Para-aminobenzoate synthase glutamine amidotransferase component II [Kluyvera cryocrescens]